MDKGCTFCSEGLEVSKDNSHLIVDGKIECPVCKVYVSRVQYIEQKLPTESEKMDRSNDELKAQFIALEAKVKLLFEQVKDLQQERLFKKKNYIYYASDGYRSAYQ
jgi:hypothetical protein